MTTLLKVFENVPPQICANTLWDHIKGWEVIVAVLIIMAGWSATNIARMHYMVLMSRATRAPRENNGNRVSGVEPASDDDS
jgi:hypothetical protein